MPKKKNPTTDHAAIRATIAETSATRQRQYDAAMQQRDALGAQLDAARARRDADRLAALADGDPAARERYAQATADVRGLEDQLAEQGALILQIDAELGRLIDEEIAAKRAEARDKIAALVPTAVATVTKIDEGLRLIVEGVREHRDARIAMAQAGADGDLPDAEMQRLHDFRAIRRKVAWTLGSAGLIDRPMSGRYMADQSLADVERALLLGATPLATATADDVIDADTLRRAGDAA